MTPTEAISDAARVALGLLDTAKDAEDVIPKLLTMVNQQLIHVAAHFQQETADPETMAEPEKRACAANAARNLAGMACLIFALCPWVKDLPAPKLDS